MEKNQEFTVTIEDMSEDGSGIGKLDGYIWFIKDTVIGDQGESHEDEKILWFCPSDGGDHFFCLSDRAKMPCGPSLRGLPASGHEI